MTKFHPFLFLFLLVSTTGWSQKTYTATHLDETPLLDGQLDDHCWQQITPTNIPLTSTPVFGLPALPSEVRLFYTDNALYVAATFSGSPVRNDGSQRDDAGLGDWFSVGLDTWDDDQNAFVFTVNAAGVQREQRVGGNAVETNWDAVWQSAVTRQADGWSVEIRLPFTSLRFPKQGEQRWGLQFTRFDRSSGVLSTWNPRQPQIGDEVLQYGSLEGFQDIHQRQRLSMAVHGSGDRGFSDMGYGKAGFGQVMMGIDGRWGFQSNSTLDVTLLPSSSFSWYKNDTINYFISSEKAGAAFLSNKILPEPRQLLAEERPMFDKGNIFLEYPFLAPQYGFFAPGEYFSEYNRSRTLAAAKFSTRLPGDVGIGVYSTLLGPSSATVINYLDPAGLKERKRSLTGLSNYTLLTIEKAWANNSWISLSNASLWGRQPLHNNLSALDFQLRDHSNQYQVTGNAQLNTPSGGDTTVHTSSQYQFSLGKVNGAWTWQLAHSKRKFFSTDVINNYTPFDLHVSDYYRSFAQIGYRDFNPRGWRQNTSTAVRLVRELQQNRNLPRLTAELDVAVLNRRFQQWTFHLRGGLNKEDVEYNFFYQGIILTRRLSPRSQAALSFRSDDRKRLYYQAAMEVGGNIGGEQANWNSSAELHWVITPKLRLGATSSLFSSLRELRALPDINLTGYYVRQYNAHNLNGDLQLNWFCTSSLNIFGQLAYTRRFYTKQQPRQISKEGILLPSNYAVEKLPFAPDFRVAFGLQWFFAPISQLRLQYGYFPNRAISEYQGVFYTNMAYGATTHTNLAFIYFLDGNRKKL